MQRLGLLFMAIVTSPTVVSYRLCCDHDSKCERTLTNIIVWDADLQEFVPLGSSSRATTVSHDALRGQTLRVSVAEMPPYVKIDSIGKNVTGFVGDIWNVLEEFLHFRTNLSVVENFDLGTQMTVEGSVDVFLAAGVAFSGFATLEFSQPYFYNWYQIYMRLPSRTPNSTFYIRTLTPSLWYACLATFFVLTLTLRFTVRALNRVSDSGKLETNLSLPTCFLSVVAGFCNQGFEVPVTSYAGRIQLLIALIFGYMVYSSMSAILVSELAVSEIQMPIKSLEDVVEKQKWSLCVRSESFVYTILDDMAKESPKLRRSLNAAACRSADGRVVPKEVLCRSEVAVLESQAIMSSAFRGGELRCDMFTVSGRYYRRGNSIILNTRFKQRRLIYLYLEKLRGNGILHKLQSQWVRPTKEEEINPPATIEVTLYHVKGILVMYSAMLLCSLAVFIVECIVHKYQKPRLQYIE